MGVCLCVCVYVMGKAGEEGAFAYSSWAVDKEGDHFVCVCVCVCVCEGVR